ncbi:MFS transporter [Litchfieldia salsa]|uniref:MFS-type transporter involved in bile tolerance, Atg22 family n=1 Tax=Litchfieldia salsa TaxID=930152 RepID=A0A1H0TKG7_9BACI|nr:MFS transporter [Litchfieldia salsa]SDP54128.1 MFS-type transporter involved in bile tolerance, Atg22 family [Litchfieldia salsa]
MGYSPKIIRYNEKISIWNGAASVITNSFITSFIPLFAIGVLGASNQQVGLLSSLPPLMSMIAMIPGAIWINRLETKKKFTAITLLMARFFLLLLIFIPFINFVEQSWILVVMIALMNLPTAITTLSWQSFIGDLIPDQRRGQFFSERSKILTIVGMVVTFSTGISLNFFEQNAAYPYQVLFLLGFIFGVVEVYFLFKHIEHKKEQKVYSKEPFSKILKTLLVERQYTTFLICAVIFNFGWQMAWPLFSIYQINDAHASAFWISLFAVANQISQILSYKWWARKAEQWGNSIMLFIAGIGMALAPILTILSTNLIYLVLINFFTGIFVAGTVMLLFNQLLRVSPDHSRTAFLASYNIVLGAVGFIAPQIGVLLLEMMSMSFAMSISSIIRLVGGLLFLIVVITNDKYTRRKKGYSEASI